MKKIIQSPSWDRIVTILKNETLCVNELARRIGLERPHMIEAAKDPATGICPELAARIHYAFPAYSIEWLRTGLGLVCCTLPISIITIWGIMCSCQICMDMERARATISRWDGRIDGM